MSTRATGTRAAGAGTVVLAGGPQTRTVVDALCRRLNVVAVVGLPSAVPHFADVDAALASTTAATVCLLTPNYVTFESIRRLAAAGVDVLCAGPPAATPGQWTKLEQAAVAAGARLQVGGRERHAPALQRLRQLGASSAFGDPVYLRAVAGGGTSVLAGWWSLCDLYASACWLLRSTPARAYVGATRSGRSRLHITMTMAMRNRANAQLSVTPGMSTAFADNWMLGSGGSLSSHGEDGDILVTRDGQRRSLGADPEVLAEPGWITDFAGGSGDAGVRPDASTRRASSDLLKALRRALKDGGLQRCELASD